jgi:capsular exopolysaccharide synthesis family protein
MGFLKNKKSKAAFANTVQQKTLHKHLGFTATEQYKLLRANLAFTVPEGTKCPVIGVTSSMRGEGKSTTAVNLSYVLAENGSKVLLIDGDLRIPSIAKKMDIPSTPGLTDMLMEKGELALDGFRSSTLDNWYIMPSGNIPPNPSELLGSERMAQVIEELKQDYDYIIMDLPPVTAVSDAMAVSKILDGVIMVVRGGVSDQHMLEEALRQLDMVNVRIIGFAYRDSEQTKKIYNSKYSKKYYKYYAEYVKKQH